MAGIDDMLDFNFNPFYVGPPPTPTRRAFNLDEDSVIGILRDLERHEQRCVWKMREIQDSRNPVFQRYWNRLQRIIALKNHYIYN